MRIAKARTIEDTRTAAVAARLLLQLFLGLFNFMRILLLFEHYINEG
jgi:hypothetical protein